MWILTGPFDAEDLSSQKSKLLKTGKSYSLGRKGQPLLVASKKVSQHHCTFTVRAYTLDDVHDPDKQPKLEFVNERDKGMRLTRADTQIVCGPKSTVELRDGDVIFIVTGLPITVKWQSICCYSPNLRGKSNVSLEVCSKLGISIVYTPSPHITHHIIPTYIANASVAASLISAAQFVKLEWLSDILKNIDTLEETFVLPPISKYRPTFSPSLSPSQKVFRVWEPNEERLNMFAEYRFLVFGEKIREVEGDLRELIKRGGGYLETFDVAGGVAKLHKALTRGQAKEGQQLVAVADTKDVKAAIGQDEWKKLVAEVRSFGLHITSPETIVQSVLDIEPPLLTDPQPSPMDVDIQDSLLASTTSLPSYVPNSIPDEPSIPPDEPPPPRKRLLRRATSRQPSVEPTSETPEVKSESPKPRRLLLSRRAKTVEPNDNGEAPDKPPVTVEPTPGRPRLKRRLGAAAPGSATAETPIAQSQLPEFASVVGEPPLKKFKALFDASDPSRPETGSIDEDVLFSTGARTTTSQTQSQTQGFVRRPAVGSSLTALREEEEESQSAGGTQRGMKRNLGAVQEEDRGVEMVGANDDGEGAEPARKRQALENVNSVERTTATTAIPVTKSPKFSTAQKEKQPGAPVGKPDTDAEFLKAVASTKKGKRTEDVFDREFNNLRISKPRLREVNEEGQREEEEWRKFTDFGDDAGLRGNFMVVMEMSIFRKEKKRGGEDGEEETEQVGAGKEVLEQWKDKPNFKKFKKKSHAARGALVELVVSEDNDYDAPAHWKSKPSQRTASSPQMRIKTESQSMPVRSATKNSIIIDDDSDENEPPRLGKRKAMPAAQSAKAKPPSRANSRAPSIRAGSKPPSRAGSTKRTTSKSSKQALFLESDEDIEEADDIQSENGFRGDDDEEEEEQTLRSSGAAKRPTASSSRPKRVASAATANGTGRKAATIIIDDDDSDDGAVFGGFGRGRRGR